MWDTATIGGRASYHKKDLAGARILPRNFKHHLCLILELDIYLLHDLALKHVPYSTMMESLSQIYVVDLSLFKNPTQTFLSFSFCYIFKHKMLKPLLSPEA